jgi:V8-like Glu-specific endopeptidase
MQQVLVFALVASVLAGAAQGKSKAAPGEVAKGNEGRGFGVPLFEFGAKHMSDKQDPFKDVAPLDLDEKLELTRGACNAWRSDMLEAVSDDQSAADKMLFSSWLPTVQEMYKRENKRELRGEDDTESNTTEARQLNIFLPNDIVTMTPANMDTYPARTVGRLVSTAGTCTATIIYEDLVLTNRHCLGITSSNQLPAGFWGNTYLQVGLTQSVINYQAYFGRVRWSSTSDDYAILQLLEPIGLYTGWPGIQFKSIWSFLNNQHTVSYVGYSGVLGGNAGGVFQCHTRNGLLDFDDVHHDCDATRGSSGSALMTGFGNPNSGGSAAPYIVALNFGEYRDGGSVSLTLPSYERSHRNVAKPASVFGTDFWNAVAWAPFPTPSPTRFPTRKPTPKPTRKPISFTFPPVVFTKPIG